jgi:hypothetical protein
VITIGSGSITVGSAAIQDIDLPEIEEEIPVETESQSEGV